jgi:hypothetical protein
MATTKRSKKGAKASAGARSANGASGLSKQLARKALDGHTAHIKTLQKNIESNAHAIGARLETVARLELHTACGYSSIEEYADKELGIGGTTAFQYMRVAKAFTAEMVATFGVQKCDWAIVHVARTPQEDDEPREVLESSFQVPNGDGKTRRKAFKDMRLSELRAVASAERDKSSGARKKKRDETLPSAIREKLVEAGKALDKAVGPKAAPMANVEWTESGKNTLYSFTGIPAQHVAKALKALLDTLK